MGYQRAVDVPLQMQWDIDSRLPSPEPGTAPGNCGPTAVEQVATFYRDQEYGIYRTRRLAASHLGLFTTITEQADMLRRRGVPCSIQRPSVAGLHALVSSGRRPVIIGLDMSRVPLNVSGHPFRGSHAVTLRAERGLGAFDVADPNFSPYTGRLDPTRGHRLYPDWVITEAYWKAGKWAIVPDKLKVVAPGSSPTPGDPGNFRADGDPYPMRMRSQVPSNGALPSYRLRAGKPIRSGPKVSDGVWMSVTQETRFFSIGYIDKDDLPAGERVYGDVLMTVLYRTNGDHIGYIKHSDIA